MNSPTGFHRERLSVEDAGRVHGVCYVELKRAYNQVQMMKQAGVFDAALEEAIAYDKKLQIEQLQKRIRELEGSL